MLQPDRNPPTEASRATGLELFIVEGESAGLAVQRVCDRRFQSVMAMQGKPMNAWKASSAKVLANELYQRLIELIGAGISDGFQIDRCRFDKVILLFDPDADGIHGCSLMLWFFHRWMPPLLASGRLFVANPPICELFDPITQLSLFPRHPLERDDAIARWKAQHRAEDQQSLEQKPFRGLASLGQELLSSTCVSPETRRIRRLQVQDAQASLKAFGLSSEP